MEKEVIDKVTNDSEKKFTLCNEVKEFPFKSTLSFEYLIDFWREEAKHSNPLRSAYAKTLLEKIDQSPEISKPINDLNLLNNHNDLIDQLMTAVYPPARWESQISTSNAPFQFQSFYSSPMFNKIFGIDKDGKFGNAEFNEREMLANKILTAYLIILRKYYNKKLRFDSNYLIGTVDESTRLKRYFKIEVDPRFINIKTSGKPPALDNDKLKSILDNTSNLDQWREIIPPENFEFVGFATVTAVNVTDQEILSQLKHNLLESDSIISMDRFLELQQKLRNFLRIPDLRLGLAAFGGEWDRMMDYGNKIGDSFILNEKCKTSCETIKDSIYAGAFRDKRAVIIEDVSELDKKTLVEKEILNLGIKSIIIAPLYDQDELIGLFELGSPNKSELNSLALKKLKEVLSLFSIAVKRSLEETQNKIQALIKEECTAIHPAVEWRFQGAAFNLLQQRESDPGAPMEEIIFDKLYPLYGLTDIRNSSVHRNDSIQTDLVEHLTLVRDILNKGYNIKQLPVLDEMSFRTKKYIDSLLDGLNSGDEISIMNFLKEEVDSIFEHIKGYDESLGEMITQYDSVLDGEMKVLYRKRKDYEDSVMKVNEMIGSFLDSAQEDAQQMYPHYFESYTTDGVEHSIYVGESLVRNSKFSPLYLKNLRLWQLIVLCGVACKTELLKSELKMPLETTHLILVQNTPLSIRFRYDEKKFDVDGTYNLRYEIMKKRIDKAIIKNTQERLTMPGKIAVVYSQPSEALEYKRYFEYLQSKGYIMNEVEELELAALQGVQGLKALRISVDFNSLIKNEPQIISDLKQSVRTIPELVN